MSARLAATFILQVPGSSIYHNVCTR